MQEGWWGYQDVGTWVPPRAALLAEPLWEAGGHAVRLSTGQRRGRSETPVRKGFGDHTHVGMVIGGKTPKRLPVLFVSCPEPS